MRAVAVLHRRHITSMQADQGALQYLVKVDDLLCSIK